MRKHITPTSKPLFEQEERIGNFLLAVPYTTFSETGLSNIAKRFNITLKELQQSISEFEAERSQAG